MILIVNSKNLNILLLILFFCHGIYCHFFSFDEHIKTLNSSIKQIIFKKKSIIMMGKGKHGSM
jgi:hypothetical protein